MGWARTLLLGDIGNRLDIEDAEGDISKLRQELRKNRKLDANQQQRIELLEEEIEQLEIMLAALARILEARGLLDPEEIRPFVEALEPRDEAEEAAEDEA